MSLSFPPKKGGVDDVEQTQVLTDAKAKAQEVARKAAAGFYYGGDVRGPGSITLQFFIHKCTHIIYIKWKCILYMIVSYIFCGHTHGHTWILRTYLTYISKNPTGSIC